MKRRLLCALLVTLSFAAWADDTEDKPATENLPKQDLTPAILYQFLLAEIAGGRGEVGLASEAYLKLAQSTRDPRIARRAAEIALYSQRQQAALTATRLWLEVDPQSVQARQMMTGLLAAVGSPQELAEDLSRQLAAAGANIGPLLMQLNRLLARQEDKQAVQRLVVQVTEPYPRVAEAHFARAQAAHAAGDKAQALDEIDRALALRPDWEHAALIRVQLMADTSLAVKFLGAFLIANPKARDARLAYARALVSERNYSSAREQFGLLLESNPNDADIVYAVAVLSVQLNDLDRAEAHFKDLITRGYAESNSVRVYLGQIAEERKRWDEALEWYGQVTVGEQYVSARTRGAHVLARQNRFDEARRLLQDSVATTVEERDQLLILEAQMLRDAGRADDAYRVLEGGLALRPDQPDLLYETALTAEKAGRNDVLERNLRRLIEIKPDYAHAYNALGYSLADRNERLDEAQSLIDKALQLSPEDPFILDSKGWILFRRGDGSGALDVLKKAFAIRSDPEIAAHIGEVLWSLGRREEARRTLDDAIKGSPDNEAVTGAIKRIGKP